MAMAMLNRPPPSSNPDGMPLSIISFPAVHKKVQGTFSILDDKAVFAFNTLEIPWSSVVKHQVSPVSHPKHLLQLILYENNKSLKFEFGNREVLNRIRTQITQRLKRGTKRPLPPPNTTNNNATADEESNEGQGNSTPFSMLSPTTLSVTRASLLSSNPTLRAQHALLVPETLSESDFWSSHETMLADEAARIHGKYRPGQSSSIKSNLDLTTVRGSSGGTGGGRTRKKIKLGVEEMRQIFIMYPAVHRAYEEKVPLDWSEEQFWRKYLESEYFHRDRGRVGSRMGRVARKMGSSGNTMESMISEEEKKEAKKEEEDNQKNDRDDKDDKDDNDKNKNKNDEDENEGSGARVSGTEDIFSRNDTELQKQENAATHNDLKQRHLAVGQFDLTSTYFTERSHVGLPERNLYPDLNDNTNNNLSHNSTSSVVRKYNRHWAMVLNPEEATAHTNLLKTVASKSITHVDKDDETPKSGGGRHSEMVKLVSFANCQEGQGDHVKGLGEDECQFAELELKNIEAYRGQLTSIHGRINNNNNNNGNNHHNNNNDSISEEQQLVIKLANTMTNKIKNQMEQTYNVPSHHDNNQLPLPSSTYSDIYNHHPSTTKSLEARVIFPAPSLGKRLLTAISRHMSQGTQNSQEHVSKLTAPLSTEFKQNLISFFRRSSELLRHFFGLRRLLEEDTRESENQRQKLIKIVKSMETVYREMEDLRKSLPQTEQGEIMKKMCMPIMDQLDYAFKLNQGSGGGFSTVWN